MRYIVIDSVTDISHCCQVPLFGRLIDHFQSLQAVQRSPQSHIHAHADTQDQP